MSKLSPAQTQNNTTRGSTPGLIDPVKGVAGGVVPWPVMRHGIGEARRSTTNRPVLPAPGPAALHQALKTTQEGLPEQEPRLLAQPVIPGQPLLHVPTTVTNPTILPSQLTAQRNQSLGGRPSVPGRTVVFNEPSRTTLIRDPMDKGALVTRSSLGWPTSPNRTVTSAPYLSTLATEMNNTRPPLGGFQQMPRLSSTILGMVLEALELLVAARHSPMPFNPGMKTSLMYRAMSSEITSTP